MQTAAKNSFLLTDISSYGKLAGLPAFKSGEFYQHLLLGLCKGATAKQHFLILAHKVIAIADAAYTLRQSEVIEQASNLLLNLPLPQPYRRVGQYYLAVAKHQQGNNHEAFKLFEHVADDAPLRYRARAVQLLGMIRHTQGDFNSALPLYVESCRIAASENWCDPATLLTAQQNIAVMKSMYGDHRAALAHLESLLPLVKSVGASQPYKYCLYLNSLAVELGEVGRIEEARNICKITLASPYAFAYPEWRETSDDLERKGCRQSRSAVSFLQKKPRNLLYLPVRERSEKFRPSPFHQPRGVTTIAEWKKKMGKEPNGNGEKKPENLTSRDMVIRLMNLTTEEGISDEKLRKILEYAEKVLSEPD
jgi:hypothetical protein